jgi:hypothetical protein
MKPTTAFKRLEYLRGELRGERISYEELHELQSLASFIDPDDVELLEAAGVRERSRKPKVYTFLCTHEGGSYLKQYTKRQAAKEWKEAKQERGGHIHIFCFTYSMSAFGFLPGDKIEEMQVAGNEIMWKTIKNFPMTYAERDAKGIKAN